ncbi:predicted protein [Scheffersomyces stipitis CBS 6054]|uniref:Ribosomal protein/NADH dehydrogenase domain-containing protein n=1 Tax=Scheffersomyces stipitis (strain ATCC 58785 / CBS 6054 / NBRC 10063 / NRRL Y-11545) TaxID=322104 RepID=A3LWC3_PICST|nr:predicted protein [Scheffersomyces stipitis CBS 6054]ABN66944.2 predicted protein [Scheffersomyces stipitis CBS 6054]
MAKSGSCAMFKGLPSSRILKQITRLNAIAGTSESAYKFDASKYTKIELFLQQKNIHGPAVGLKKFWRQNLPTLKFHNDDIQFSLTRIQAETAAEVAACPSKIVVHSVDPASKIEIDCKGKHSSVILNELVEATKATNVPIEEIPVLRPPQQKESWAT